MPAPMTADQAGNSLTKPSRRDPEQWALGVEGPVDLGEADARLLLEDKRMSKAVRQATRKLEIAGKQSRCTTRRARGRADGLGARNEIPAAPSARERLCDALRELRHAGLFVVLFIPVLPMLFPPGGRYGGVSEPAALRFFEVTFASYLLVCVIQLTLLAAWALNPLRWQLIRMLSGWTTLLMLVVVPWWMLMAATPIHPRIWAPQLIPFGLAMLLAAANLWAAASERSRRARCEEDIQQMRTMLQADPDADGLEDGPRGPVRELRRIIRRLPEPEQKALDRRRVAVLGTLEARGLITPQRAERAAELPLGRWHELDG